MATIIYSPNYALSQISANFFKKGSTPIATFVSENFTTGVSPIDSSSTSSQPTTGSLDKDLLLQIAQDYGNGPVSNGLTGLVTINQCVINSQPIANGIFNNFIINGIGIDFRYVTKLIGRDIVLKNLSTDTLLGYVPLSYQTSYYTLIDSLVSDLKNGIYSLDKYNSTVLQQSKQLVRIINNGTTV